MDQVGSNFSLKDRLLDNTAKSIKRVQEYVFAQSTSCDTGSSVLLTNDDAAVQPLFKHLDRLFMSGLKKMTNGYWNLAVELSHKEVVKELKILTNVSTNIGKGRAWLYHALSENLLECYLRTIETNTALVKRYYEKEALFFDQQRMQILITLCSGLECVGFQLDYDVPYLDVDSYLHINDQDTQSVTSTTSKTSANSGAASNDVSPVAVTSTTQNKVRPSSFKADEIVVPNIDESFEVERIITRQKKKKKRKKPRAVSMESDHSSRSSATEKSLGDPESNIVKNHDCRPHNVIGEIEHVQPKHNVNDKVVSLFEELNQADLNRKLLEGNLTGIDTPSLNPVMNNSFLCNDKLELHSHEERLEETDKCDRNGANNEEKLTLNTSQMSAEIPVYSNLNTSIDSADISKAVVYSDDTLLETKDKTEGGDSLVQDSEVIEPSSAIDCSSSTNASEDILQESSISQDSVDGMDTIMSPSKSLSKPINKFHEKEIIVDNNVKLTLMLEVFDSEDEQFHKMFETTLGHSEGNIIPINVLLTDCKLYLLRNTPSNRYTKHAVINYNEIDYLSLSLGSQVVQIVCTNRRRQFWLTTGSQAITKLIVDELKTAMRLSGCHLPQTNILTDATTQRIALTKWVSQQCRTELSRKDILCFLLGYWEDRSPGANIFKVKSHKEGVLLYKLNSGYIGYAAWKPGYFVLSNGILYQYEDKDERHTPLKSIQIGSDECGGCRRSKDSDREHSFEIILSNGAVLHLSAATSEESNEWLQCLCQAVSEGQMGSVHNAVACCIVVTPSKIMLCHEDLQTEYFRTLASANIVDVTSLGFDSTTNQYLVINFESQESHVDSEQWAVYLCGSHEWTSLVEVLDSAWSKQYQVSLPVIEIDDASVTQQCRDTIRSLKRNA